MAVLESVISNCFSCESPEHFAIFVQPFDDLKGLLNKQVDHARILSQLPVQT